MLYLGYKIALALAEDTVRATLAMSTATARAALTVGVKIEIWIENALAVAVHSYCRVALAVSTATARACSIRGSKNLNHIIIIVKTDCCTFFSLRHG